MTSRMFSNLSCALIRELRAIQKCPARIMLPNQISASARFGEPPAAKTIRFRYPCEGRSAGSIQGVNTRADRRTYPSIVLDNYAGRVIVVATCVTNSKPHYAHPNNLVGLGCTNGVFIKQQQVVPERNVLMISQLGIQCVRKADVQKSLNARKAQGFDPYSGGFDYYLKQPRHVDLHALRICFQIFVDRPDPHTGRLHLVALPPLLSDTVFDKKSNIDLIMTDVSDLSGPCTGGQKLIVLCDKVTKEDIAVRFIELAETDDDAATTTAANITYTADVNGCQRAIVWSAFADMKPSNVHKQVGIVLHTPAYRGGQALHQSAQVLMQLFRPSDGATSEPHPFVYRPVKSRRNRRKKRKQGDQQDAAAMQAQLGDNGVGGGANLAGQQYAPVAGDNNASCGEEEESDISSDDDDDESADEGMMVSQQQMLSICSVSSVSNGGAGRITDVLRPVQICEARPRTGQQQKPMPMHQLHPIPNAHQQQSLQNQQYQPAKHQHHSQQPRLPAQQIRLPNTQLHYTESALTNTQRQQQHKMCSSTHPSLQLQPHQYQKSTASAHQQPHSQPPKSDAYQTYNPVHQHQPLDIGKTAKSAGQSFGKTAAITSQQSLQSNFSKSTIAVPHNFGSTATINRLSTNLQTSFQPNFGECATKSQPSFQLNFDNSPSTINNHSSLPYNFGPTATNINQMSFQRNIEPTTATVNPPSLQQSIFEKTTTINHASLLEPDFGHTATSNQSSLHLQNYSQLSAPQQRQQHPQPNVNQQQYQPHNDNHQQCFAKPTNELQPHQLQQLQQMCTHAQQHLSKSAIDSTPPLHQHGMQQHHLDITDAYGTQQLQTLQQLSQQCSSSFDWSTVNSSNSSTGSTAMQPMEQQPSAPEQQSYQQQPLPQQHQQYDNQLPSQVYHPSFGQMMPLATGGSNEFNFSSYC